MLFSLVTTFKRDTNVIFSFSRIKLRLVPSEMVSFYIELDKLDKKYKAGDTIYCKLIVTVFSKFKSRSFSIRFKGVAHTEWTKSRSVASNNRTRTVYDRCTGHEDFFKSYKYIFRREKTGGEQELEVGTYHYDVSFDLPDNLPSR